MQDACTAISYILNHGTDQFNGVRHQAEKLYEKLQSTDVTSSKQVLEGQTHSYLIFRVEGAINEGTDPTEVVAKHLTDTFS